MLEYLRQGSVFFFVTTKLDTVMNWGRKYSMFLYPFVTACCGMEFMAVAGPRYDIDRFGCALPRSSCASLIFSWWWVRSATGRHPF